MATIVFLLNLTILVRVSTTLKFERGVAQVFTGDCHQAEQINTWAHFGINAVSTMLLSGSNYCMQILSAPTRIEIDTAHAKKKWLDIGVPSVRNLKNVARWKVVMWWLLGLSSLPLHLLYNSVVFASLSTNEYDIVLANEAFVKGGPQSAYNEKNFPELKSIQNRARYWDRLEQAECIDAYATEYLDTRRNLVIVVTDYKMSMNTSVKRVLHNSFRGSNFEPYGWICDAYRVSHYIDPSSGQGLHCTTLVIDRVKAERLVMHGWHIDYCLSERVAGKCRVSFSLSIMIVVMVCNVGKALLMFHIAFRLKDKPLVTIGDAIDSFSNNSDHTTREMCLNSKESIRAGEILRCSSKIASHSEAAITGYDVATGIQLREVEFSRTWKAGPIKYEPRVKGWFSAVTRRRGVACLALYVMLIAIIVLIIVS